jgi:hypothetical protein
MDANSYEAGGIFDCACTAAPTLLKPERPIADHLVFVLTFCLPLGLRVVRRSGAHDLSATIFGAPRRYRRTYKP